MVRAFIGVEFQDHAQLFQVALTGLAARRLPRPGQGRQQDGRKNADNGDDHQQFNQCKSMTHFHIDMPSFAFCL
ncbi:MAG: hypothetical protein BWX80_04163 [Candidatus Hydrogenedentes bacterium ADurb.Bin101]|nr:MAG: hypothetical protein BWX80_04163 [Candidatus Hydrogenedentes bacterium ADurb.Bin101]